MIAKTDAILPGTLDKKMLFGDIGLPLGTLPQPLSVLSHRYFEQELA